MHFFLIHGAYGNPQGNWIPWLKRQLEASGHSVDVPHFPTPENQSLENWLDVFKDYKVDDAIFVAHSLGPVFVLNLIKNGLKPKHCFFVAPFHGSIGDEDFDGINSSFMIELDWKELSNATNYTCYLSDNDPYVPMEISLDFAAKLNAQTKILPGAGHINTEAGFTEFPQLLDDIKTVL